MEKKLLEITRSEWIGWQWIESQSMGEEERTFLRGFRRTPDEAAQAMEDWDSTAEERESIAKNENSCNC
jgi:hypothetical protein